MNVASHFCSQFCELVPALILSVVDGFEAVPRRNRLVDFNHHFGALDRFQLLENFDSMHEVEGHHEVGRRVAQLDQLSLELHQAGYVVRLLAENSLVGFLCSDLDRPEGVDCVLEDLPAAF